MLYMFRPFRAQSLQLVVKKKFNSQQPKALVIKKSIILANPNKM